jgi:hypothetical protein
MEPANWTVSEGSQKIMPSKAKEEVWTNGERLSQ